MEFIADPSLAEQKVSLPSKEMALWEALETICSHHKWQVILDSKPVRIVPYKKGLNSVEIEVVSAKKKYYNVGKYEVEAGFAPDKTEIIMGEPLFITFFVKNVGDKPFHLETGGDYRGGRAARFKISAVDADGNKVKDPFTGMNRGGIVGYPKVDPGECYAERRSLPKWCEFERPGTYMVTCKRTLNLKSAEENPVTTREKTRDQPVSTKFSLTIHPYTKNQMDKVIEQLGEKVRSAEGQDLVDATVSLSYIDDEQVVPHLVEALARGKGDNEYAALDGLAKYPTEESIEALTMTLVNPDESERAD